jgi:hypothetical protein
VGYKELPDNLQQWRARSTGMFMERLYIPTEDDFRRWIKEALKEYFDEQKRHLSPPTEKNEENFLNRKQIAAILGISLVTLHIWMNRGLPFHKHRGRVYFIRSEVVEHVKGKQSTLPSNQFSIKKRPDFLE